MPAPVTKAHARRQDRLAQHQLRRELAREHRPDLSASDLAVIANLTGNRGLAEQVRKAYGKDQK